MCFDCKHYAGYSSYPDKYDSSKIWHRCNGCGAKWVTFKKLEEETMNIEATMQKLIDSQENLIKNLESQIKIQQLMIDTLKETNQKHMETIRELSSKAGDTHQADVISNAEVKCYECGKHFKFGFQTRHFTYCNAHYGIASLD